MSNSFICAIFTNGKRPGIYTVASVSYTYVPNVSPSRRLTLPSLEYSIPYKKHHLKNTAFSAHNQDGGCAGGRGDVYDVKRRRRRRKSNSCPTAMEKEKEDLERQIRLLQGLISCHRKLHGNAPATSRWRNPAQPDHGSDESYHGGGRPPLSSNPTHTWRKKYSLVNRCEPAGPAPRVPSNAPSGGDASAPPPLSDGQIRNPKVGVKDPNTAVCPLQVPTTRGGRSNLQHVKHRTHPESPSTSAAWQTHPKPLSPAAPPSKATSKASLDVRPPSFPPDKAGPPRGASAKLVYPRVMTASPVAPTSSNARVDPAKRRLVTPHKMFCSPKSSFALQGSAPHASKTPRARKNKYTWVANSAKPGLCGKKSSPLAKKIVSADAVRTKSPTAAVTTKAKKCSIQGKPGTSRNRYRWKANQPSLTPSGPASVLLHLSVPQSTDQGSAPRLQGPSREAGKGLASPAALKASLKDQMPSSYKVKSRTKLIRRRSSSSPTEKKALPLEPLTMKSRYSLRRRSSPRVKTQIVVKKTSPKGLVHITKHRLRRLPPPKQPDVSRAGGAACHLVEPRVIWWSRVSSGGAACHLVEPRVIWWSRVSSGGAACHLVEPRVIWWSRVSSGGAACHLVEPACHLVEPACHLVEPACHLVEPACHLVEPACHLVEPACHLVEPACHLVEPAHHPKTPIFYAASGVCFVSCHCRLHKQTMRKGYNNGTWVLLAVPLGRQCALGGCLACVVEAPALHAG
uniref:Uncharacterized protein n=1 Tax=Leptobrachium leishanense TaxID=445787 RepID=A0A8C5W889_9ANUR